MAITATMAVSPSTVSVGQAVHCTVTVAKDNAGTAKITGVRPFFFPNGGTVDGGGAALGQANVVNVASPQTIPGSGNTKVSFDVIPSHPQGWGAATATYDCYCVVTTDDATTPIVKSDTASVTVNRYP